THRPRPRPGTMRSRARSARRSCVGLLADARLLGFDERLRCRAVVHHAPLLELAALDLLDEVRGGVTLGRAPLVGAQQLDLPGLGRVVGHGPQLRTELRVLDEQSSLGYLERRAHHSPTAAAKLSIFATRTD